MQLTLVVPGSLDTPTGGYRYDRQVVAGLRAAGHGVTVLTLGGSYPQPDAATLQASYRALSRLPPGPVVVDGLALGALPDIGRHLPAHAPLIALVHHPLALESGIAPDLAERLRLSERQSLVPALRVIVSGPTTGDILVADYDVLRELIHVALPGVAAAPLAQGSGGKTVQLVSVGSVIARKGHDLLIEALGPLADLPWHLTIVGDVTRDAPAAQALRRAIATFGFQDRVTLTGALSEEDLALRYDAADLFVLASRYEGYGMVFSEALAHGLPVVATAVGEAATLLPQTAGKLVAPGDTKDLSEALRGFIIDPGRRLAAREAAKTARATLPTWEDCVTVFEKVLRSV